MIRAVLFDYGKVLYGPILPHRKVRGFAKTLRANEIKTGILSNVICIGGWLLKISGGYRNFDPVILSFKEKIAKPNAEIYQIAIKKLGVKAEEIIFIDNLEPNITAAKALGMKVVLAKHSSQVIEDVKKILRQENHLEL